MRITADDLAENSVLAGASAAGLTEIARRCHGRSLRRGEYLYRQGDQPGELYFQLAGTTRALLQLGRRRPLLLHSSFPHDGTHGLRDLLIAAPRTTSVVASEPSRFAVLPAPDAFELLPREPKLLWAATREMSNGLDRFAEHAADIGLLDLPRRVAKDLLDPVTVAPRWESQDDIALRLGASRQSVNKALTVLTLRGWVERRGDGTVGIRDQVSVRRFVDGAPSPLPGPPPRAVITPASDSDWDGRGHVLGAITDAESVAALRAQSRVVRYPPGETIHREGDVLTHLAVLVGGEGLATSDAGRQGTYVHDTVRVDGLARGLSSLFRAAPPTVSLRARTDTTVLEVPAAPVAAALLRSPTALLVAAREIAVALSGFLHTAAELAVLRSTARVARALLANADDAGQVVLPLTQGELGVRLGLTRQSVNRALTELRDNNMIESTPAGLAIRNRAALHRFVYLEDE